MKLKNFLSDTFQPTKGSMKISTKGVIEAYREKYDLLSKRTDKPFRYSVYTMLGDRHMVHIKVPSETVDRFYYDVLLELTAEKSAVDFGDCDVKIFSNCPSFVYSVAYIFAHWDPDAKRPTTKGKGMMIDTLKGKLPRDRMLIPGTEKKLGKQPIHEPPVVRNPLGFPMFDKSVYYAIFFLMDNISFKDIIRSRRIITAPQLLAGVESFDSLMAKRKKAEQTQKAKRAEMLAERDKTFKDKERKLDRTNRSGMMRPKSASTAMKTTRTTSSTRKASTVKSTRRVTSSRNSD